MSGRETTATPSEDGSKRKLRIAVAGCSHGEMDKIYAALAQIEKDNDYKIDLLICCGDYQAVRNYGDLAHMHVPDKYKSLQTFYKYYSGEKKAPMLTLFVGGNHEASGYLSELPNGGWVAPSIYYLGFASVIRFAGLRIGGLSGIFKGMDYRKGHFERPPYHGRGELVSAYHVRNLDVWRLKQLRPADEDISSNPIDIMISHDWPSGITDYGDVELLLRVKPYFRQDIERGQLGNSATLELLKDIRPRYWLSAHLHCMFPALVPHEAAQPTRFLALDKPIPRRHFLQVIDIEVPSTAELDFSYDPEWLAILRNTDNFTTVSRQITYLPSKANPNEKWDFRPTKEEIDSVLKLGDLHIPKDFYRTAPPITGNPNANRNAEASLYYRNPQSTKFCKWLGINDLNALLADTDADSVGTPYFHMEGGEPADENEIRLDDEDFGDDDFILDTRPTSFAPSAGDDSFPSPSLDNFEAPKWRGESGPKEPESISTQEDSEADCCCSAEAQSAEDQSELDNFEAPKWRGMSSVKGSESTPNSESGELVFKRRKVELNEDAE